MATVIHEHHIEEAPLEGLKISWGGVWAGVLVVLGTLLLLSTLGMAIGVSSIDPRGGNDAGAFGTGAAIWTGLSLLVALFVGGMAATRLGMVLDKAAGTFEGGLVWVLSMVAILWLAGSGVSLVAGGVADVFGVAARGAVTAVAGTDDLAQGDVAQMIDRLNSPTTTRALAAATGLPEQDVRNTLSDIGGRVNAARNDPAAAAAEVRRGVEQLQARAQAQMPQIAERVQGGATKTAWSAFAVLVLSLAAAVIGSVIGRRKALVRVSGVQGEDVLR